MEGIMPDLNDILAVILGGGRGTRLYPLTKLRAKPAVPMAGKYRLIDIPISNCINSHIYRIAVLTQFNTVSLHRHIARTYYFDAFHSGWVQIWASQQTVASNDWYQGTADAVRKQIFEIRATRAPYVLILAGDHLYRMDYAPMARFHWEAGAEITVAVHPAARSETSRLGILKRDKRNRITDFAEKPKNPRVLADLVSRDDPKRPFLSSMGIYLFNTELLCQLLEEKPFDDFGGHVIPYAIQGHKVYGYDYDGYWEDIGTIRSFYETNLQLAGKHPPFDLFDPDKPMYTHARFLPGSTVSSSRMEDVLLAEGCIITEADIANSVIGLRSRIQAGVRIRDSIIMGADYYEKSPCEEKGSGHVCIGIGRNSRITGAIIDKNARIGHDVVIQPFPPGTEIETEAYAVRDGIVVIPKNTTLPAGTVIAPKRK
jgi:glucose-1-phosphate adenylyltransferase